MWLVTTRIVGIDHAAAGITHAYEARANDTEPWVRLSFVKLRIVMPRSIAVPPFADVRHCGRSR